MTNGPLDAALRSAWPSPAIDNLLRAVTLHDLSSAAAAWRAFEARADFDNLTWGEFRLISLAAKRVAQLAPESPLRPRIAGIERSIWSRSQLAIGEAAPILRALQAASIDMLVVKGASRAAGGDPADRGRAVNDIDVCVRPDGLERAFDIVTAGGWVPAGSGTILFHRSVLADMVGINLVRGKFGNLDLHRTAFHAPYDRIGDDDAIWRRSLPGKLGYNDVRIPAPTDAIAIAIAHGALDAHKKSDWLADIAAAIDAGVDWDLLADIIERRRMAAPGAIALGYMRERLERPVPAAILVRLMHEARRHPIALFAAIAETSPKARAFGIHPVARLLAKQSRLIGVYRKKAKRQRLVLASILPARRGTAEQPDPLENVLEQDLQLPDRRQGEAWTGTIDMTLLAALPAASRRVDFEINTKNRHHLRLRGLVRNRGPRQCRLRFRFSLSLASDEINPVIAAAPSRSFNSDATQQMLDRYRAVKFRVLSLTADKISQAGNPK
jgi:Uncharacterised nucleotidyltransferase